MAKETFKFFNMVLDGKKVSLPAEQVRFEADGSLLTDHLSALQSNYTSLNSAVNAFLNGEADGGEVSNLNEIKAAISEVQQSCTTLSGNLDTFLNGEAAEGSLEKRSELVAAITALQSDLSSLNSAVNAFLEGDIDGGDLDRLKELVKAINDNKDSIDALVSDKISTSDIINDLTTGGAGKVLSAEQGKQLKLLVDALNTDSHTHANSAVLNGISKNDETGNLVYNGHELNGETGIAYLSALNDTPNYTGKMQLLITSVEVGEED